MESGATLRDAQTLMAAKAVLVKAARGFATAIEEATSEAERFAMWLGSEGPAHWERQRRMRTEKLNMDRGALFRKQMQPTADGLPPSTVDERKLVARSERAVQHAEECLRQLRKWAIEYQRQLAIFRAGLGPLSTYVDNQVPNAILSLNRMAQAIDSYLTTAPSKVDSAIGTSPTAESTPTVDPSSGEMRRGGTDQSSEQRPP